MHSSLVVSARVTGTKVKVFYVDKYSSCYVCIKLVVSFAVVFALLLECTLDRRRCCTRVYISCEGRWRHWNDTIDADVQQRKARRNIDYWCNILLQLQQYIAPSGSQCATSTSHLTASGTKGPVPFVFYFTVAAPVCRQPSGTLQPPDVARKIASGAICPVTLEPWGSDFTEALGEIPQLESLALPNRKRRKRAPPGDTNNYHRTGFSRLPQDCQLEGMTVSQLREFLEVSTTRRATAVLLLRVFSPTTAVYM